MLSAADDVSRPGLVLGSRFEVGNGHLHRLHLHELGWEGAGFVAHHVTLYGHVLALDAGRERKRGHGLNVVPPQDRKQLSKLFLL